MKKTFLLAAVVIFAAVCMQAGDKTQTGTIISENSVSCGSKVEKKKETELLCQEYVVRTDTTDYHIRQMKPVEKGIDPDQHPHRILTRQRQNQIQDERQIVRIYRCL